jgi:transcriptional regulator with XRE-family HTH domain
MYLADRIRQLREAKNFSQGDIEKRSGLLRCYLSRVENGHTVPSLETLEKIARALGVPLYQFFYNGAQPPAMAPQVNTEGEATGWPSSRKERRFLTRMRRCLSQMDTDDRTLLVFLAGKMTAPKRRARA